MLQKKKHHHGIQFSNVTAKQVSVNDARMLFSFTSISVATSKCNQCISSPICSET